MRTPALIAATAQLDVAMAASRATVDLAGTAARHRKLQAIADTASRGINAALERSRAARRPSDGTRALTDSELAAVLSASCLRDSTGQPMEHDGTLLETVSASALTTPEALRDGVPEGGGAILGPVVARCTPRTVRLPGR